MNPVIFRWQPGLFLKLFLLVWLLVTVVPPIGLLLAGHPISVPLFAPSLGLTPLIVVIATLGHTLIVDDLGIEMRTGNRRAWILPWSEITGIRHESATFNRQDHLVISTAARTRKLTFTDRWFGCWNDPAEIKRLLRARGYSV